MTPPPQGGLILFYSINETGQYGHDGLRSRFYGRGANNCVFNTGERPGKHEHLGNRDTLEATCNKNTIKLNQVSGEEDRSLTHLLLGPV